MAGDLDNILVHQKNAIIRMINEDRISDAKVALDVVRELWNGNSYAYKVKEIEARISDAAECWSIDEILIREG